MNICERDPYKIFFELKETACSMIGDYQNACDNKNIDAEQIMKYLIMEKYCGVYIDPIVEEDSEYKGNDMTYKKISCIDHYWHDWIPNKREYRWLKESINNVQYNYNGGSTNSGEILVKDISR